MLEKQKINALIEKLELLYKKQASFNTEINDLKRELYQLKFKKEDKIVENVVEKPVKVKEVIIEDTTVFKEDVVKIQEPVLNQTKPKPPKTKSSLEKFIGENILNKIGIFITVIGVAIGAKYSIENDLISPLTRIILGYISAVALLGFGIKLKKKYEAYSAVLVSGSIVVLYFITYFAYSFYNLIPQPFAFVLMVLFTMFAVVASLNYNRQIIAHFGLVGAYAVPFLLSNNSGRVGVLFSYMTIINIGVLIVAYKKYWKPLYYSAFVMTWLIFSSWYSTDYITENHYGIALAFLFIFFIIFYAILLAYKLLKQEKYVTSDIILLLVNSFVFYGLGFAILNSHDTGSSFLGLFTLCNAVIHFGISTIIYKQKLADKSLLYLVSGLVLVFITIAIPVQLDGNWVTLLWVGEAALLFWIGRTKNISVYEKLSYPLMILAFFSIMQDWSINYDSYQLRENTMLPLLNTNFLNSILYISAFCFIVNIQIKKEKIKSKWYHTIMSYGTPIILVFSAYYAFRLEINAYWDQSFYASKLKTSSIGEYSNTVHNYDLRDFESIWVINYSLFFFTLLALFNFTKIKNKVLGIVTLCLTVITILVFLIQGLYVLSDLRASYLQPSEYYNVGIFNLGVRYESFAFLAFTLFVYYKHIKQNSVKQVYRILYDLVLHISMLWLLSSELIHWMDVFESNQTYKLGLSILWGLYSFLLIAFGIWKRKQYLRIGGIGLFGITLIKLFFYDIAHLNTISKTIAFVSLGILLLIISFLYNKYKHLIVDEVED